jgi:hypothetical protein
MNTTLFAAMSESEIEVLRLALGRSKVARLPWLLKLLLRNLVNLEVVSR